MSTCLSHRFKQAAFVLLGSLAGFFGINLFTPAVVAPIPIAGIVAGAVGGFYLYKHCRFFENNYRIIRAAEALTDKSYPQEGVKAALGRAWRRI